MSGGTAWRAGMTLEQRARHRKLKSYHMKKPENDREDWAKALWEQPAKRLCMMCRRMFRSEWVGHRICGSCKELEAYRGGASMLE